MDFSENTPFPKDPFFRIRARIRHEARNSLTTAHTETRRAVSRRDYVEVASPTPPRGAGNRSDFQGVLRGVAFRGVQVLREKRLLSLHENRVRRTVKMK